MSYYACVQRTILLLCVVTTLLIAGCSGGNDNSPTGQQSSVAPIADPQPISLTAFLSEKESIINGAVIGEFDFSKQQQLFGTQVFIVRQKEPDVLLLAEEELSVIGTHAIDDYVVTVDIAGPIDSGGVAVRINTSGRADLKSDETLIGFTIVGSSNEDGNSPFQAIESEYDSMNNIIRFVLPAESFEPQVSGVYSARILIAKTATVTPTTKAVTYLNGNAFSTITGEDVRGSFSCPLGKRNGGVSCVETSRFNKSRLLNGKTRPHKGMDFSASNGTAIYAQAGARLIGGRTVEDAIELSKKVTDCSKEKTGTPQYQAACGSGAMLVFRVNDELIKYFHLSSIDNRLLTLDQSSKKQVLNYKHVALEEGDLIAQSGNTGTRSFHLHTELHTPVPSMCKPKPCPSVITAIDPFERYIKDFKITLPLNNATAKTGETFTFTFEALDRNGASIISAVGSPNNTTKGDPARFVCFTTSKEAVLDFKSPNYIAGNRYCYQNWQDKFSASVMVETPVVVSTSFIVADGIFTGEGEMRPSIALNMRDCKAVSGRNDSFNLTSDTVNRVGYYTYQRTNVFEAFSDVPCRIVRPYDIGRFENGVFVIENTYPVLELTFPLLPQHGQMQIISNTEAYYLSDKNYTGPDTLKYFQKALQKGDPQNGIFDVYFLDTKSVIINVK